MKLSPQQHTILKALNRRPHSRRDLENLGSGWINSAQKRISELKEKGFDIRERWEKTENSRYKVYWLEAKHQMEMGI